MKKPIGMKFDLGIKGEDKITGLKGTLTGFATYVTGCNQYLITPSVDKDNKPAESVWLDENRIKALPKKKEKIKSHPNRGCCESAPIK